MPKMWYRELKIQPPKEKDTNISWCLKGCPWAAMRYLMVMWKVVSPLLS